MDRARAAGYIDNNFVQNQQRLRKRRDHLARIRKIMNRKPGTSVTLDNNPPTVQQATAEDPRKKAKRGLFSVIIERENKVLLQRISAILVEPARNTVKEYDAMKKLIVPKNQGRARLYDQHVQKVRNEKFFESLRNQKPVYNVKVWEKEYEHQKYNQRFMREVKYSRPPGFVDPYAPAPETEPESPRTKANRLAEAKKAIGSGSPGRDSTSSAHINRVRSIRAEHSRGRGSSSNGFSTSPSSGQHGPHQPRQQQRHHHHHGKTGEHGDRNSDNYDDEGYEDGDYEDYEEDLLLDELEEFKELLAEVQRDIRVTEEVACAAMGSSALQTQSSASVGSVSDEIKLNVYLASAELRCWLVNGEVIVLSARVIKEEPVGSNSGSNKQQQQQRLEAEAEISLEDLAVLRGEDHSVLSAHHLRDDESHSHQGDGAGGVGGGNSSSGYSSPFDMATLQQIAAEMVAHVELRVDLESGARLILNLVSEEGGEGEEDLLGGAAGDEDFQFYEHDTAAARGAGAIAGTPSSLHTQSAPHTHGQQQQGGDKDSSNKTKDSRGPAGGGGGFEHDSLVSEEELGDMLIDDNKLTLLSAGMKIPVHFESQVITASVANLGSLIDAAKIKSRHDFVYALVKAVSTEDDQLCVTVTVMNNTVTQFKRFARPAVVKGTVMKITTSLPSVIHADPDLIYVFTQNLVSNIKIVHSNRTGKNALSFENL